jgi:hypothetical protein
LSIYSGTRVEHGDINTGSYLINHKGVEVETLASSQIAKLNGNKASAHAKKLGGLAARGELERVTYFATNPGYEGSVKETECGLLSNGVQRELLSSMITACVASRP